MEHAANTLTKQDLYIREHRRHHRTVGVLRVLVFLLFLILWEGSVRLGTLDSFFFSSPILVLRTCVDLWIYNDLAAHIGITLVETLLSFFLVTLISMSTACLLWFSRSFSEVCEPYLVILNSLPKSALAPLFIVWLGTGMDTIIVAGISVAIFGAIISIYSGFRQASEEKLNLIYTLGGSRTDMFRLVVLPSSVPLLLSTMKVNIGLSLVGVIIGEFLAARRGLGYLIIYGSQVFKLHMVISSILILCLIAFGLYRMIQGVEHLMKKHMHLA